LKYLNGSDQKRFATENPKINQVAIAFNRYSFLNYNTNLIGNLNISLLHTEAHIVTTIKNNSQYIV